jgi:hypothetical protein
VTEELEAHRKLELKYEELVKLRLVHKRANNKIAIKQNEAAIAATKLELTRSTKVHAVCCMARARCMARDTCAFAHATTRTLRSGGVCSGEQLPAALVERGHVGRGMGPGLRACTCGAVPLRSLGRSELCSRTVNRRSFGATQMLCRNLQDNPNIVENNHKIQKERTVVYDLLERTVCVCMYV